MMMHYMYAHTQTEATTGYFSCNPHPPLSLEAAVQFLAEHPLDDFMRRHAIHRINALSLQQQEQWLTTMLSSPEALPQQLPLAIQALIQEVALLHPAIQEFLDTVAHEYATQHPALFMPTPQENAASLAATPLIFLRWKHLPDRNLHTAWGQLFADNIQKHLALPPPTETGLAALSTDPPSPESLTPGTSACSNAPFPVSLAMLHARHSLAAHGTPVYTRPPSAETAALAKTRLTEQKIIAGQEMRHIASLSPIALLRPWRLSLTVEQAHHAYTLEGQATTYGRGLCVDDARASCLMEMVERASAYLSVGDNHILKRLRPTPLTHSTRSALLASKSAAIDPNDFPLEVPYEDAPLYWMPGHAPDGSTVFVPVQMASLFCNLDEISLFDSPGSTGIATGCTLEEAKVAALVEVFERDAEATQPFTKASCFTLAVSAEHDPLLAKLLLDYKVRGMHVQFQDLTGQGGVPVFKCFLMSRKGVIARGHGAGLNARRALISALTETPYPYPNGGPSGPALRNLPVKNLQDFPDYSLPTPAQNLCLLEELLTANGRPPVYVDLTRDDLLFPVVRALVPGMELAADSDTFTRVPLRLYKNYRELFL